VRSSDRFERPRELPAGEVLDCDQAVQEEVRNAARTLLEAVLARRSGHLVTPGRELEQPRQK